MRSFEPFSPEDADWFCRHVLSELGTYRYAVQRGERKAAGETFGKTGPGIAVALRRLQLHLHQWLNDGNLLNPAYKKIVPTEAGRALLAFAEDVMGCSEAFLKKLQNLQYGNHLRVAIINSGRDVYAKRIEASFRKRVSDGTVEFNTFTGMKYPERIDLEVREWRADVGITSFPGKVAPPLALQPFVDRELRLVFNAKYTHLPKGKVVRVRDVFLNDVNIKIVIHPRALDGPLSIMTLRYLKAVKAYADPDQRIEAPKIDEIKSTIAQNPGTMGILPSDVIAEEVKAGQFVSYRLDPPMNPWEWGLIYRPGTSRHGVSEFIESLRPLFKTPHKT